eukprot:13643702-Ditylum_brightwellii.AAC.1
MKDFIALVWDKYGIKQMPITSRNPQANSIVERAHQTIGNLLCVFKLGTMELDPDDLWSGILSSIMFPLRSTIHTTHKATHMQLVFCREAMLNITYLANWCYMQENHQKLLGINNKQENLECIPHEYCANNKVMLRNKQKLKYRSNSYSGPYK